MDVSLFTQSESHRFVMRELRLFNDGSGGACFLEVISAPFSASVNFFFDTPLFEIFVENLVLIERTLVGEAKLGLQHEEPYVLFSGNGRGHINVSGLLIETGKHMQKLEFSFTTDQTSLGSFVVSLREVCNAPAV